MNLGFHGSATHWQLVQSAFSGDSPYALVAVVAEEATEPQGDTSVQLWPGVPPSAHRFSDFDELVAAPQVQGVILGGPISKRAERLRRLIQVGKHCLCFHPVDHSPLTYHELAMVAQDGGATLVPWLPGRLHPAWAEFAAKCHSNALGPLRHIVIERTGPLHDGRTLVSQEFAEVLDLMCDIVDGIIEITATGDLAAGRLVVHHRTAIGTVCEIRVNRQVRSDDRWQVTIHGESGRMQLVFERGLAGPGTIYRENNAIPEEKSYLPPAVPMLLLDVLQSAAAGLDHTPSWSTATRVSELADWAWYSLERRRAVDVVHEQRGELASFKGRMTSFGCGLIWFTLLILIVIAAGKGLDLPGMQWLAVCTAIIWVIFLAMQALRWTFPSSGGEEAKRAGV